MYLQEILKLPGIEEKRDWYQVVKIEMSAMVLRHDTLAWNNLSYLKYTLETKPFLLHLSVYLGTVYSMCVYNGTYKDFHQVISMEKEKAIEIVIFILLHWNHKTSFSAGILSSIPVFSDKIYQRFKHPKDQETVQ